MSGDEIAKLCDETLEEITRNPVKGQTQRACVTGPSFKIRVSDYLAVIRKYYLSTPGYSYVNDVFLTYQEAVLIHYVLHNLDRDYIDSAELDEKGLVYDFWWTECAGNYNNYVRWGKTWDKVLVKKKHANQNFFIENGKRVPWKELPAHKRLGQYEKRLKEQRDNPHDKEDLRYTWTAFRNHWLIDQ